MSQRIRSIGHLFLLAGLLAGCGGDADTPPAATATVVSTPAPTPTRTPLPLTSATLLQSGPYGVGVTTITFEDASRPTAANGGAPASPSRRLVTEIWYPVALDAAAPAQIKRDAPVLRDGAPYPLIVHSHGFMDMRTGNQYANRHLASYGYIVAAPDFPLTNFNTPGGANVFDVVNQPGDVGFLISQLLSMNAAESAFSGRIDPERIGISGLSLGGGTTLLTAFHPTLHDPRVRAAATIAPGFACAFNEHFYNTTDVPLMILHGDIDAIVAYPENAVFAFGQANPPKYLVKLIAGSHTGFSDVATSPLFAQFDNPDELGCSTLTEALPSDALNLVDLLGGAASGVVPGNCPAPCPSDEPLPAAMRPARQHDLTTLSLRAFFESTLRGRADTRNFLGHTLAGENTDTTVQFEQ